MSSLLVAWLLACGSPAPEDLSALTDDELAVRTIAFMDEMIAAGTPHLEQCDALARELQAVVRRNEALLAVTAPLKRDPAKKQWFDEHYGEQIKSRGMWFQDEVLPRCGPHPGVQAVVAAMR